MIRKKRGERGETSRQVRGSHVNANAVMESRRRFEAVMEARRRFKEGRRRLEAVLEAVEDDWPLWRAGGDFEAVFGGSAAI